MKSTYLIALLVLTLPVYNLMAQHQLPVGRVLSASDNQPIVNANLKTLSGSWTATTDSRGQFLLPDEKANGPLITSHVGYQNDTTTIDDRTTEVIIILQQLTGQLQEVVVYGELMGNTPFPVTTVDQLEMQKSSKQDIGNRLRQEPNVGGIRKGAMGIDPVVRGLKYSQLNVQLDGGTHIEGGCPNRMDPATAHVDINDLKQIAIYKGPYALKYGPAFGGVIRLIGDKPEFHQNYETHLNLLLGAQTNYEGYKTRVNLNGGNRWIAYGLSGTWNKYGDYQAGNGDWMQGASNNWSGKAQLALQPVAGQEFHFTYDHSQGRNIDFPTLPMDERSDDTRIYDVTYQGTNFGPDINFISAHLYSSEVHHIMDNKQRPFSDTVVAVSDITANNSGGRLAVNFSAFSGTIEAGTDMERITKNGNRFKTLIMQPNMPVITESLWNNALITNLGGFAEYSFHNERMEAVLALRLDMNQADAGPMLRYATNGSLVFEDSQTQSQYTNFSFSMGAGWYMSQHQKVSVSLGRGVRSPDMTERYIILLPVGYDNYDYLGNPSLLPESNHSLEVAWLLDQPRWGKWQLSVFGNYITHYITAVMVPPSEVTPQTKGVLGVKRFTNIDKAYLTGFEAAWHTPENTRLEAGLTAAMTMGINPEAHWYVVENGQVTEEKTIKNDPLPEIPPFEANLTVYYPLLNKTLKPGFKLRMAAPQNRVSQAYYEETTPGFSTLDLMVTYRYNEHATVNAGINNVTDVNYYEHLNRRVIGSDLPYLEPGRIFFVNIIVNL